MPTEQLRFFPEGAPSGERRHVSPHQPMGGGPEGETCGNCIHLKKHKWANTHYKCEIWTKGSTVKDGYGGKRRKSDPACPKFRPRPPGPSE